VASVMVYPPGKITQIVARYRTGDAMKTIANAEGVSYAAIRNLLRREGVQIRPRSGQRFVWDEVDGRWVPDTRATRGVGGG
jgi:hypothetical protein